jgi:hypothetical protein
MKIGKGIITPPAGLVFGGGAPTPTLIMARQDDTGLNSAPAEA